MNPSIIIDITQIPTQLSGLTTITYALAIAMLALLVPYSIIEMNVQAAASKRPPAYGGFFVRVVVALACLLSYQQLYSFFLGTAQAMGFAILSEQSWGDFLVKSFSAPDSTSPVLSWLTHPLSSVQAIVLFLSSLIAVTAKDVIVMLQACFLSLLFAFGPIAIVCAISERTFAVTRGWIVNSFQVGFWSFFLRLVVLVWLTINPLAGNTGTGWANDFLGMLTVNVTFLLLILGTPIFTARIISGDSLAAFGEAAVGVMQTVTIAGAMRAGRSIGNGFDRYKKTGHEQHSRGGGNNGGSSERAPDFQGQQTSPTTATAAHEKLFGRKPQPGTDDGKEKGKPA